MLTAPNNRLQPRSTEPIICQKWYPSAIHENIWYKRFIATIQNNHQD
uniref:Uncharacterized protein n=1 Tax=Arundo donax TaxID=35708 RepID=A0A0A9BMQ3_ARUDO